MCVSTHACEFILRFFVLFSVLYAVVISTLARDAGVQGPVLGGSIQPHLTDAEVTLSGGEAITVSATPDQLAVAPFESRNCFESSADLHLKLISNEAALSFYTVAFALRELTAATLDIARASR